MTAKYGSTHSELCAAANKAKHSENKGTPTMRTSMCQKPEGTGKDPGLAGQHALLLLYSRTLSDQGRCPLLRSDATGPHLIEAAQAHRVKAGDRASLELAHDIIIQR